MEMSGNSLIDSIYEAGIMPSLWPDTLAELARFFRTRGALLMVQSGGTERWTASPSLGSLMRDFEEQGWSKHNIRAARCRSLSSYAGFVTDQDIATPHELETLPIYTEFLRPRSLEAGAGTTIQGIKMDGLMITLEGFDGYFKAREAVAQLDQLRPHLARAAAISARMKMEQATAATDALAAIGSAAAVLATDATIVSANSAFSALVASSIGDRTGRLTFSQPGVDVELSNALAAANSGIGRSIAVRRAGQAMFVIHVAPLLRSAQDVFSVGAALAVIDVPGRSAFLDVQTIRSLYDLTPAESKVACLVAEGRTPAEAAKSLGVSMETIRTHLTRTYAKTGTERQAGLSIQLRSLTGRLPNP
ncbi:helix-turn-helix transcriptional regulator [Sphingomonas sp. Leaf10]|uniref:helix-turn-helix transcriptional regulator n=1 Tax=Sphingomonas sp. Leaf10 TaxID=1735676 RepID=UPI0006F2E81F|nr:helix-turn-helix transcriptional regulator [Sphingomonas sp. Leaf10]KQM36429.1 hypothetical protein ASE59_05105 [Sphingomonas sp. Leaf10]